MEYEKIIASCWNIKSLRGRNRFICAREITHQNTRKIKLWFESQAKMMIQFYWENDYNQVLKNQILAMFDSSKLKLDSSHTSGKQIKTEKLVHDSSQTESNILLFK